MLEEFITENLKVLKLYDEKYDKWCPFIEQDWWKQLYQEKIYPSFEQLMDFYSEYGLTLTEAITSGYRTREHQKNLNWRLHKASKISIHEFGVAFDIVVPQEFRDVRRFSIFLYKIMNMTDGDDIRLGFWAYRKGTYPNIYFTFIHIDWGYEIPEEVVRNYMEGYGFAYYEINEVLAKLHRGARW